MDDGILTTMEPVNTLTTTQTNDKKIIKNMTTTSKIKLNTSAKMMDYLKPFYLQQDDNRECTNTRIGAKGEISGGKYHIPEENYNEFLQFYHKEIIKKDKQEFLTEKQRETGGPIMIDVDFRYKYEVTDKQYTIHHIRDVLDLYLVELKTMFQFDDSTDIQVFVFEKDSVNRIVEKNITKDGIHLMICLQADRTTQLILRKRIIDAIDDAWNDIEITNSWDEVFDKGISEGSVNWQLYGSCKPYHDKYKLTHLFVINYDENDGELSIDEKPLSTFNMDTQFKQLSVRNTDIPSFFFTTQFAKEHDEANSHRQQTKKLGGASIRQSQPMVTRLNDNKLSIFDVRNHDELEMVKNDYLENIPPNDTNDLKEVHDIVMILSEKYYGEGSYQNWLKVGIVLHNICKSLFVIWVVFSARHKGFRFDTIGDMFNKWKTFAINKEKRITLGSLIFWAKEDAPEEYKKIQDNSVNTLIRRTLQPLNFENISKKNGAITGSSDWDMGNILYQMFKDRYLCSDIKKNEWYKFKKHRWVVHNDANDLRKALSTDVRCRYMAEGMKMFGGCEDRTTAQPLTDITARLGKTTEKQNIIKEARSLFYDEDRNFVDNLDTNGNLLCFNNGVIDFSEPDQSRIFRKGSPEDNISFCTNIEYIPLTKENKVKYKNIIDEINDFMTKLFPELDIRTYMWNHLASAIIGVQREESFHNYIGCGANGKSKLVDLLKLCLGDYIVDVDVALITGARGKLGAASPDIQQLKGIRYAVMNEPSKGEKLNDGVLKLFTGGDGIAGRGLYKEKSTKFIPQFKLVCLSNQQLKVVTQDEGTWRRIRVVPFKSKFTNKPVTNDPDNPYQFMVDTEINKKFQTWKEIFMSMLVDIAIVNRGVVYVCDSIRISSNAYRESQDYIAEFIRDKVVQDKNGKIKKTELNSEFSIWYMSTYGRGGPPPKEVHAYMDKAYGKTKQVGCWLGVKIRYERDEIDVDDDDINDDINDDTTGDSVEMT